MSDLKKSAWDGYRRWRVIARVAVPVTVCLILCDKNPMLILPFFMIAAAALIGIEFFNCPKCAQTFFYVSGFTTTYSKVRLGGPSPFAQKCVHCGFPKWEEPPEKAQASPPFRERIPRPDSANTERLRLAEFLTLILRDDPGAIDLRLDSEYWADVDRLVDRANRYGIKLTRESLADVSAASENQRFEWDQPGGRIRAIRIKHETH